MLMPLVKHKVVKGDNLTKIVKRYGFGGGAWKRIYNAPYNKAFRKKRTDPNLILPGDEFLVPAHGRALVLLRLKAILALIPLTESLLHQQKVALKEIAKALKNVDALDEGNYKKIRHNNKWMMDMHSKLETDYLKCRSDMRENIFEQALNLCHKSFVEKRTALYSIHTGYDSIEHKVIKGREDPRKVLQALEKGLKSSIKKTEEFLKSLDKARAQFVIFSDETF